MAILDPRLANKKDMGLAGAILVLSQVLSSYQSTQKVTAELADLKGAFTLMRSDQEKYFVKKEELVVVVRKLDQLVVEMSRVRRNIKSMSEEFVTLQLEPEHNLVGACALEDNRADI